MTANPGPERIQQIDHAKKLLHLKLKQLQEEAARNLDDRGRLWLEITKLDNERASIINSHLVDA